MAELVVVAGAGASSRLGLDNKPIPMMAGWMRDLVDRLNQSHYGLANALDLQRDGDGQHFELMIGRFLAWRRALPITSTLSSLGAPDFAKPNAYADWHSGATGAGTSNIFRRVHGFSV